MTADTLLPDNIQIGPDGSQDGMSTDSTPGSSWKNGPLRAIAVGGGIAWLLDLAQAVTLFGPNVPLLVAAALAGTRAFHGGIGIYILGLALHLLIFVCIAAIYYVASRRLSFLKEHWLVCGLFYGMATDLVMRLIVLPLSALHARGPFTLHDEIQALAIHMIVVGLPVSYSVRQFAK